MSSFFQMTESISSMSESTTNKETIEERYNKVNYIIVHCSPSILMNCIKFESNVNY